MGLFYHRLKACNAHPTRSRLDDFASHRKIDIALVRWISGAISSNIEKAQKASEREGERGERGGEREKEKE